MNRTIVIGDVHGCVAELTALLELVAPRKEDTVCFVGDLVARGPDSRGVLKIARDLAASAVRGNHEERLLEAYRARLAGLPPPRLSPHHERVLTELREEDWALIDAMPLFRDFPEHDLRVVHAGVVPGVPFEQQEAWTLTRIRSVDAEGNASEKAGSEPWAVRYSAGPHIVFGHDSRRLLQLHANATGIDTGCVFGGSLTALVLPAGETVPFPQQRRDWLVSVSARDRYYVPSGM